MKKYAAFTSDAIPFLKNAVVSPDALERREICFEAVGEAFVPDFALPPEAHGGTADSPDARRPEGRNLLEALRREYVFLPMDTYAVQFAFAQKVPYRIPADLLAADEFYATISEARQKHTTWRNIADARDFGWSENWFAYDDHLGFHFRAARLAARLVPVLERECDELLCISRTPPSLFPMFKPNDLVQSVWAKALPEKVRRVLYPLTPQNYFSVSGWKEQDFSVMKDALVFAFSEMTLFRHTGLLHTVRGRSKKPLALAITQNVLDSTICHAFLSETVTADKYKTVIIPGFSGTMNGFDPALVRRFKRAIEEYFPQTREEDGFFTELAAGRFFNMERMYKALMSLWSEFRPSLCVGEDVLFGEFSIPFLAARKLGIPSVSVPHGSLSLNDVDKYVPADSHIVQVPLEVEVRKAVPGRKEEEIVCFQELDMDNSHPTIDHISHAFPDRKKCILVAMGAPLWAMPLLYGAHPAAVRNWLAAINAVPRTLANEFRVFYKLHPGFTDLSLLESVGIRRSQLLPLSSSLPEALSRVDTLVSCEYASSPGLIGMKRGIPVIHCIEEGAVEAMNSRAFLPFVSAGKRLRLTKEFWPYIHLLHKDSAARQAHIDRQNAFLERDIHTHDTGLVEYLEKMADRALK